MKPMKHIVSTLAIIVVGMSLMGCALFDFNGDGKVDPLGYLQDSDITVTWVDAEGDAYTVDAVTLGSEILYNYIEYKTGYRFELAPQQDGTMGIWVKDPKGQEIWIIPAAPEPDPPPADI